MKTFFDIAEQTTEKNPHEKTVVFTFGRFQPPTRGHQLVFDKVKSIAKEINAEHRIYFSRTSPSVLVGKSKESLARKTERALQNPIDPGDKHQILTSLFPEHNFINDPQVKTAFDVFKHLGNSGVHHAIFVGDETRGDIVSSMQKYIGHPDFPNLKSVNFEVSGNRDPDSDNIEGVSGTKARLAAEMGDHAAFHSMMPDATHPDMSKSIMHKIRQSITRTKVAVDQFRISNATPEKIKENVECIDNLGLLELDIDVLLEKTKDPTRKRRDHRMYGWGKSHPSAKQLSNRRKKNKRTVARRKANESGRTTKGDKSVELDHKNGNANDNSADNLRVVSRKFNRSRNNNKWRK
jgi:hypothetical protein